MSDLLTIEQCAEKAQCSTRSIRREIGAGKLLAHRERGRWRIKVQDWENYLLDRRYENLTPREKRRVVQYALMRDNPEHEAKLTADAIRANRAIFPFSGPAVYFLWKGDELVYIGQAVNLLVRVASHLKNKEFDGFSYVTCRLEELNTLERRAILMWQPKLNKMFVI